MPVIIGSGSQSPSQRGRAELSEEIAGYVLMPDSPRAKAIAVKGMNDAIRMLNTRPWQWSTTFQDITLTAGTADYDLSSDFLAPRTMELLNSGSQVVTGGPGYTDPAEFAVTYNTRTGTGSPCAYTVFNDHDTGQLTFDLAPDSNYVALYPTVRLRYFRRTPYLEQDSDVLDAPSEVESWVTWWACFFVATRFDPGKMDVARRTAMEYWQALIRSEHRQLTSDWSH